MSPSKKRQLEKAKKNANFFLQRLIKEGFSVEAAYLYGSYARGSFTQSSDIDICIISKMLRKEWDKGERYLWRQTRFVDPRIEPIGFSPEGFKQSYVLRSEIKRHSLRLI